MVERKCVGCGKIKDTNELIKITRVNKPSKEACDGHKEVIVNHSNKIFGRSAYLCYNNACIEAAFKKDKISKILKASVPEDLKGKLLNEF